MGDAALLQETQRSDSDLGPFYVSLPDIKIPRGSQPFPLLQVTWTLCLKTPSYKPVGRKQQEQAEASWGLALRGRWRL